MRIAFQRVDQKRDVDLLQALEVPRVRELLLQAGMSTIVLGCMCFPHVDDDDLDIVLTKRVLKTIEIRDVIYENRRSQTAKGENDMLLGSKIRQPDAVAVEVVDAEIGRDVADVQ